MTRYQGFPIQGFGRGLNLRDKPDAVDAAECIDAMNVTFSDRGAIQQRPGYAAATPAALTNRAESLSPYYTSSGTKQLLAGCGSRLEALNASFEVIKSATGLTNAPWGFARFGQPNSEVAYAGNGTDTLRKWSGTEWAAPTATVDAVAGKAMPKGRYLAVQPSDNRLIVTGFSTTTGGPNGVTSSPSHVFFSEAGNPESYESTAYEQLTPGDGEAIMGVIAWRELVLVFKESSYFVFYGNSLDQEGRPVFNYRPVTAGVGLVAPRALCANHTGVYFLSRQGVYRTTGQEPELISNPIEPIFTGEASAFYTGGTLAPAQIGKSAMTFWGERLYLSYPTEAANNRTLVYDPRYEWWTLTSLPCAALSVFRPGSIDELVFSYSSGENKIGRHSPAYTSDAGTAITSYWRSGWFDLGSPDIKKIRGTKAWGTGKVQFGLTTDFQQGTGTLQPLDLSDPTVTMWDTSTWGGGTWAQPRGLVATESRRAARGTTFSTFLQNEALNQEWSLHRLEHLVPALEQPPKVKS